MGVKLIGEYKDMQNNAWKVEVLDTSFSGTPTNITISKDTGAVVEWDGETRNIVLDGIRQSTCTFGIEVKTGDTALESYLSSIISYTTQNLYCNLYYKVGSDWLLKWRGPINQGGYELPEDSPYTFQMTANDGLVKLKDNLLNYVIDPLSDEQPTLLEIIRQCFIYTGTFDLYAASEPYITSTIDILERSQRTTYGMLYDTRTQKDTWLTDIFKQTPYSAFDVLEQICKTIGCQLKMWNGTFNFFRAADLRKSTVTVNRFDNSLTPLSNTTYAPDLSFPSGSDRYPFNPVMYTFDPPYKKTILNWDAKSNRVVRKDVAYPYDTSALTLTVPNQLGISAAGYRMTADISIAANIQDFLALNGMAALKNPTFGVAFDIKCGNYALESNSGAFRWVKTFGTSRISTFNILSTKANPERKTIQLIFVAPPENAELTVSIVNVMLLNQTATSFIGPAINPLISGGIKKGFSAILSLQQQVNPYADGDGSFEIKYSVSTENDNSTTLSLIKEDSVYLGDSPVAILTGGMEIYTGSVWKKSQFWKSGTDATVLPFQKLVNRELMRVYKEPIYISSGSFFMDPTFDVLHTITWNTRKLFFNAGRFFTAKNEYEGEFVQISYNSNAKPVNATKPSFTDRYDQVNQTINEIKKQIQAISINLNGINDVVNNNADSIRQITQTRSLNADKYLIDQVEGIPETGADIGSEWYLKVVVESGKKVLKFKN